MLTGAVSQCTAYKTWTSCRADWDSHEDALAKAQAQYEKYRQLHLNDPSPVEKHFIEAVEEVKHLEQQAHKLSKPPRRKPKHDAE